MPVTCRLRRLNRSKGQSRARTTEPMPGLERPDLAGTGWPGMRRSSLVVLAPVLTVSVVVWLVLEEVKLSVEGESEQEPGEGMPEQVSVTAPVYPPIGAMPRATVPVPPDGIVGGVVGGVTVMPLTVSSSEPVAEMVVLVAR